MLDASDRYTCIIHTQFMFFKRGMEMVVLVRSMCFVLVFCSIGGGGGIFVILFVWGFCWVFFGGGGRGKNVTRTGNSDFQHFYNEITRKQCICQVTYF